MIVYLGLQFSPMKYRAIGAGTEDMRTFILAWEFSGLLNDF